MISGNKTCEKKYEQMERENATYSQKCEGCNRKTPGIVRKLERIGKEVKRTKCLERVGGGAGGGGGMTEMIRGREERELRYDGKKERDW